MGWGKYWRPDAKTWWFGGVLPILIGLIVASEPIHELTDLVATINGATGGLTAPVLIWGGFTVIFGRSAIPKDWGK